MLTYDKLVPGTTLLEHETDVGPAALDDWLALYPGDAAYGETVPPGLLLATLMKVCLTALHDMPDGGIHAGQTLSVRRLPRLGERLVTTVACGSKEMKRGRRFADIALTMRDGNGNAVADGVNRAIWPA